MDAKKYIVIEHFDDNAWSLNKWINKTAAENNVRLVAVYKTMFIFEIMGTE